MPIVLRSIKAWVGAPWNHHGIGRRVAIIAANQSRLGVTKSGARMLKSGSIVKCKIAKILVRLSIDAQEN